MLPIAIYLQIFSGESTFHRPILIASKGRSFFPLCSTRIQPFIQSRRRNNLVEINLGCKIVSGWLGNGRWSLGGKLEVKTAICRERVFRPRGGSLLLRWTQWFLSRLYFISP